MFRHRTQFLLFFLMPSSRAFGDFLFGVACVLGRKRTVNQDSAEIYFPDGDETLPPLLVLADGMGGHQGGETASRLVLEAFADIYRHPHNEVGYKKVLIQCVEEAHRRVKQTAAGDVILNGMGSTVVAAFVEVGKLHVVNVGDSRAYLLRDERLIQISHDQSFVADQVRAGRLTPEQALKHPKKNVLSMAINAKRPTVTPILRVAELLPEDVILLCSDGLWGMMPPPMLESLFWAAGNEFEPQEAAEKLAALANQRGGADNISVIIARRKDRQAVKTLADDTTNAGE